MLKTVKMDLQADMWVWQTSALVAYTNIIKNYYSTNTLFLSVCDLSYWQIALDEATHPWGIRVERVGVKDVKLPLQLQRAMAAEAEASREARAKVSFIVSPKCAKLEKGRVTLLKLREAYCYKKFPDLFCNTCVRFSYS